MDRNDELHPNWKALATARFNYKQFVRASSPSSTTTGHTSDFNTHHQNELVDYGEEIMQFYNEVTKETAVKKELKVENVAVKKEDDEIVTVVDISDDSDTEVSVVDPKADKKLIFAAQQDDLMAIRKCLAVSADINSVDEFGWTPLMVAAAEGNTDAVECLLTAGALTSVKDRAGHSAAELARRKGHFHVEDLLLNWNDIQLSKNEKNKKAECMEACDVCNQFYPINKKKKHIASMGHQLGVKRNNSSINPGFLISQTNKGYQLLKKSGWDGISGLGGQQKGRLFPVKSVLKRDRDGFKEGLSRSAKVTHFAANDACSIEAHHVRQVRTKKKVEFKSRQLNKRREIQLRQDLGVI